MADPLTIVSELLQPVFAEIAGRDDVDPVVRPSDRADAQVNGALPLAKQIGANPREIAQRVVDSGALDRRVQRRSRSPGRASSTSRSTTPSSAPSSSRVAADDRLGVPEASTKRKVVVDYSAPNVAKEMHAGHLRTTVIGDALVRMLMFLGHDVIRENHIGDWGRPFGMFIEHLLDIGEDVAAEGMAQGDLDGFYKAGQRQVQRGSDAFQAAGARAGRQAAEPRPRDDRDLAAPRGDVERLLQPGVRRARRAAHRRRPRRGEQVRGADARGRTSGSTQPDCSRTATAPRSCSRPGSTTARTSRCR